MAPRTIWLATVGLGPEFGGIGQVADASVQAMTSSGSHLRLTRIVSLMDSPSEPNLESQHPKTLRLGGSRLGFTACLLWQAIHKPDLLLFDHVDLAQCQNLLPPQLRSPFAVWVHGLEVWKRLPVRKSAALRRADLLIFNSEFTKRRFESFHGSRFPSRVVPLVAKKLDDESAPQTDLRHPWILTVGRLEPDRPKGHERILAVLPRVAAAVPEVQWHIVGQGRDLETWRQRVEQSPAGSNIHVHGFLPDDQLRQLYRRSRVFAMPSSGEGFGIVYLEAMQHGCVPIGSTLDAAGEIIGEAGRCFDLEDRTGLTNELIEILSEPCEQFLPRSERAIARARDFSPTRFQTNLLEALDQVGHRS